MPLERRDFMKVLGASLASLLLTRCRPSSVTTTCYTPAPEPLFKPASIQGASARERLRLYWSFDELAQKSQADRENKFGNELILGHRLELDELVAAGNISAPVADLVHEAYAAAVDHVWRSQVFTTCYAMIDSGNAMISPSYGKVSADVLVEQVAVLNQIAEQGEINQRTLAKAQAALEHDMAFYALTDEEVQALYDRLTKEGASSQSIPEFEDLSLELTPEAREATQFLIDLLTGK